MPEFDGRTGDGVRSTNLFEKARTILGDRFAEARFDPDRSLRVTVIDLSDHDTIAIEDLARQLGIQQRVHIERADPAALEAWERLRHDLLRLRETRPRLLRQFPMPEPGYQRPPVGITLSADAEAEAENLHARYGTFVSLRVGALPYPPQPEQPTPTRRGSERVTADPAEMRIQLDGPLSIRSGHHATHTLLLTNNTQHDLTVRTNGHLTATILDPITGATVGGYPGPQRMPGVRFTAAPGQTVHIPILVDTASFDPTLGYIIPAGHWHLTAPLNLSDRRQLVTPTLELTITD